MGYRSQVVLAIGKELLPFFMLRLSQNKEAEALVFSHADHFDRDYGGDKSWLLRWDSIKWYEGMTGYEDINCLSRFVEEASCDQIEFKVDGKDQSSSEHIRFVKVGEEVDDVTVTGYGFDDIYASTFINY